MVDTSASALEFVKNLRIIELPSSALEAVGAEAATTEIQYTDDEQAVVVGSQIAEFTKSVPVDLRPHISESLLLAQLAANKSIANGGTTQDWYKRYVEVLANVGWLVEGDDFSIRDVSGKSALVHQEVIPLITAA